MRRLAITSFLRIRQLIYGGVFGLIVLISFSFRPLAQEESIPRPLNLKDCIKISLASSPDSLIAQERIEQARAAVGRAQASFYPRLSLRETVVRSSYAPSVFSSQLAQGELSSDIFPPPPGVDPFDQFNDPSAYTNWNTQLLLEWPVYRGGGHMYGKRAAIAQLESSELALRAVHNNLAFSVSSAYYEILKCRNSISVAEESVRRLQAHLDIAKARQENDVALRSDVLRVEVRLAEAKESLEIARNNLARAESRLNLAMGKPITENLTLAGNELSEVFSRQFDTTLEELIRRAHRKRSEIEAIDRNVEALEYSVRAARADYYPHVDAFAHYDVDTENFSDSDDSWTIGIGASLSIFDGFLTRSNVRSAQAQLREAEARKRQMMLQIEMDVKNSHLAKSEAAARVDVLEESVSEAEEALRIVSARYAEGLALVTDLLDVEVALTNTRLRLVSAQYDYMIASAGLDRAVGTIAGGRKSQNEAEL
jgi:outer membrane protein TolC